MRHTYTRNDVLTHYGDARPAVNVKVHNDLRDGYRAFVLDEGDVDPGFTVEWIEEHLSEERIDRLFWFVCECEFEQVTADAEEIFKRYSVRVEQDGRSGGWAVVTGLPLIEEWDAVLLAKWRKFERLARGIADYIMCNLVSSIYINEFEGWKLERAEILGSEAFAPESMPV